MKSTHIIRVAFLALGVLCAAVAASAQVVSRFEVRETVISPDADGSNDSTRVLYSLAVEATTVSVVVFEADSITPVDTLRAPGPETETAAQLFYWHGRRFDGTLVPEGRYVVTLRVKPITGPEVVRSLPVFVDTTRPDIQIVSAVPNPYAPGVFGKPAAVQITFVVSNASPLATGRPPDEVQSEFRNPLDAKVTPSTLTTTPPFAGVDGSYTLAWDASADVATLPDGEYSVTMTIVDAAGYSVPAVYHFDIDTEAPALAVTSIADNLSFQVLPDTVRGYTFDERGIDSLQVRYAATDPFVDVASTFVRDDTTFFAVPVASVLSADAAYTIDFRSGDSAGRLGTLAFHIKLDRVAPEAPVLEAFNGKSRIENYLLRGTVNNEGDTGAWVRILRDGVQVDSVSTVLGSSFAREIPLHPGRNELTAILRDGASNLSPVSNTVVVTFDTAAGLYIPAPFAPGSTFAVNTTRAARSVTLRVYDITGQLVVELESENTTTSHALPWDGRNGSHKGTRRGPLVAIAEISYPDGAREVLREVFLYNPDAP